MKAMLFVAALALSLWTGSVQAAQIVAAGDVAFCGSLAPAKATGAMISKLIAAQPDTKVLALGDLAYNDGTLTQFKNCFAPAWGSFKANTLPIPGNHEYHTAGAKGFYDYFGNFGSSVSGQRGYFTRTISNDWLLVGLNSAQNSTRNGMLDLQLSWLRNTLAANTRRCILAFQHHPRFTSGAHAKDGVHPSVRTAFQHLYDARVSLLLTAHDHDYERFAQMNPAGAVEEGRGVRHIVVGTGGAPLRGFGAAKPGSLVRQQKHGVLVVQLKDADPVAGTTAGYSWKFVTTTGTTLDSGDAACVTAPPAN